MRLMGASYTRRKRSLKLWEEVSRRLRPRTTEPCSHPMDESRALDSSVYYYWEPLTGACNIKDTSAPVIEGIQVCLGSSWNVLGRHPDIQAIDIDGSGRIVAPANLPLCIGEGEVGASALSNDAHAGEIGCIGLA